MKLAIVGGSAQSTPHLFLGQNLQVPESDLSVVLIGRSPTRLLAVQRAIRIITREVVKVEQRAVSDQSDLIQALSGANIVLIQTRHGGYEIRNFSETFSVKYGICGDEGLGPGGLAAAWISWPQMEKLLAAVRAACPSALVLMMSSPLGILTRTALTRFGDLRLLGICELPWTT